MLNRRNSVLLGFLLAVPFNAVALPNEGQPGSGAAIVEEKFTVAGTAALPQ
jgi:hypothetical protein